MDIRSLKPASTLAHKFGVKCLVYGGPGTGKTPIVKTAPRPVLCAAEPGLLSMRDATNVATWEADTAEKIDEFFKWFFNSNETKNFDTLAIDSISQVAEIYLEREEKKKKHGLQAYGEMARQVWNLVNQLYYFPAKHIYLIAKQSINDENGVSTKRPYLPGKELNVKVPHLFDEIFHIDEVNIPGIVQLQMAFKTHGTVGYTARDRSGKLAEFEPLDLTYVFNKCMS